MNELVKTNHDKEPMTLGIVHIQVTPLLGIAWFPSHEGEEPQITCYPARKEVCDQMEVEGQDSKLEPNKEEASRVDGTMKDQGKPTNPCVLGLVKSHPVGLKDEVPNEVQED